MCITPSFVLTAAVGRYGRITDTRKEIERAERYQKAGQNAQAASILRDVLAGDRKNFEANYALAVLYDRAGRADLSLPLFRKAVQLRPDAFEAVLRLGLVERDQGSLADARTHLARAASIRPDSVEALCALGSTHINLNDRAAAFEAFIRALTVQPDSEDINTKLGSLYAISGEPDKAAECFRKVILHRPLCGNAHYGLAFLRRARKETADMDRMQQAFTSPAITDHDKVLVGYALGRACEELAQYDKAFEFISQANKLQHSLVSYSFDEQKSLFDRHMQALNQGFIDHCQECRITEDTPIFVLGMPRSGTSLVEQILASHPQVFGAGEVEYSRFCADDVRRMTGKPFPQDIGTVAPARLRELGLDYIRRLKANAATAPRVVDKLPHNFLRIGFFAALMPNAKIVLCDRDPLDNCVSIYQHQFSADHGYASDLTELGKYYKLYEDLMAYWMELLPGRIHRIRYENLVGAAGVEIRELLKYCELPFHADCLSFHEADRMVVSPSALEVREPLHGRSVGRADNYRQHLQTLINALAGNGAVA
ncbi:MAG: sulfotransferase [Gammaproteobacteria bacterium]|nr:sulfotransferase [Gammaproteobacteria bacterium]